LSVLYGLAVTGHCPAPVSALPFLSFSSEGPIHFLQVLGCVGNLIPNCDGEFL
ncbi:hypothetical protein M407DRAFT_245973, partial [Tulasnella calospora MUT 4182]